MRFLKLLPLLMFLGISAQAQSPTYGVGRTPSTEEIRAWDISISPSGKELPSGSGTATEGEQLYLQKGCAGCHGITGTGGLAPRLLKRDAGVKDTSNILAGHGGILDRFDSLTFAAPITLIYCTYFIKTG